MPEPRRRRALDALGLAFRAGHAVVGTRAVEEAARAGDLEVVLWAEDASDNARGRISGALRRSGAREMTAAGRSAMGAALGREHVVVAGVTDPGLARKIAGLLGGETGAGDARDPEPSGARREE